jgi:hypothetical protein
MDHIQSQQGSRLPARRGYRLCALAAVLMCTAAVAAEPEAEAETAPDSADRAKVMGRRPDERRPDQQFTTELFGRPLTLGGQYELTHQWRENFDLDPDVARNRSRLDQELKAELLYRPSDRVTVFLQAVGVSEIDTHRSSGDRTGDGGLERGQTWVYVDRLFDSPVALQAGRIGLVEPRTWWWDDDVDAVRLHLGEGNWGMETGVGRELGRVSTNDRHIDPVFQGIDRWFGRAAYAWRRRHNLEGYWMVARDRSGHPAVGTVIEDTRDDPVDGNLNWLGLRAQGDERFDDGQRLGYWFDAGWLRGRETRTQSTRDDFQRSIDGVTSESAHSDAVDVGAMWTFAAPWKPTVTLAYARGSGDDNAADGVDHAFHQTGLQENKGRYRGVNRFRYYGELFRPELSNLSIATAAFGVRFRERSSLEVVFHDYRQVRANASLADSRLDAVPNGIDRDLGRELDLVLGIREWQRVELAAQAGMFRAGNAFGPRQGERAYYLEASVTFVF